MKISTQIDVLEQRWGMEKAIRTVAAAGFDAFDLSLFGMKKAKEDCVFNTDAYVDEAKRLRAVADSCGIVCNQAHAPFPSRRPDDTEEHILFNQVIEERIIRSMEVASIFGAKQIVVHPMIHLDYRANKEELKKMNLAFYNRLLPFCREFNIRVCLENMWQRSPYDNKIVASACNDPEEFCAYLDALDPEWFVACLDVGHAALIGYRPEIFVRALGGKRLHALHLHDVDGVSDLHTLPGMSKLDWNAIIDALAEIGYDGELTLEADSFLAHLPEECLAEGSRFMATVTRALAKRFEAQSAAKN